MLLLPHTPWCSPTRAHRLAAPARHTTSTRPGGAPPSRRRLDDFALPGVAGRSLVALAVALALAPWPALARQATSAAPAPAPAASPNPFFAPVAQGGRIFSMGQPPLIKWQAAVSADLGNDAGLGVLGVQKEYLNPLAGVVALRAEAALGAGRDGAEGAARLLVASPLARLHVGLDYDVRDRALDVVLGGEFNVRRGGLFGHGTRLRLGWLPGRDQTVQVGLAFPLGQRAGVTRPRQVSRRLTAGRPSELRPSASLSDALRDFRAAADAVTRLVMPMHTRLGGDPVAAVAPDVAAVQALPPSTQVLARMADAWPTVFAAALDGGSGGAPVSALAARARRVVLEAVLLPYAGLFGQRRTNGSLYVFAADAERRFQAEVASAGLSAADRTAAMVAFHGAFREIDGVRADLRRQWHSDRRVFVPLQIALAPEEADTQAEIDALIEGATGGAFSEGNRIDYVLNEAFQFEFSRTVALAERYHVLWIHDVRGDSESGGVDKVSALHVREYLQALTDRVQRYDETGSLPQYHIILDQFYYQTNNGRRWMTLLEQPLTHEIALPGDDDEIRALRDAQQALRAAVAGSTRLQEQRARFGEAWLQGVVKVHVNITHPSDFSFWGQGLFPLVGMPDNLMRDHRKIVFYDLAEEDPTAGEVLFSGMGLGEHYAGATWEDRAIILRGPAALGIKQAARRLFERQGFAASRLPLIFQDRPLPPDYAARVEAARAALASTVVPPARVLQSHNDVGYGEKKASVSKAILLSVMPPGSVLISPDSLWEDFLWGSLAAGSALRGCRVLVIAPSTANAPGTAWPVMTRMHMLTSRLLAFSQGVAARLDAEGGLLRVGLFNERSGVGDMGARVREASENFAAAGWLNTLIPFTEETKARLVTAAAEIAGKMPVQYLVQPGADERPKLHMKGLYAVSRPAWDGLFPRPEMSVTLFEYLAQRARQVSGQQRDVRALPEAVWKARRALLEAHEASLSADDRAHTVRYLQIGSFNMNDRSMLLDGEVELTVSGLAAQSGMLDFIVVCGLTTWVERQADIDALIAPPSAFHRIVSRWGRSVL